MLAQSLDPVDADPEEMEAGSGSCAPRRVTSLSGSFVPESILVRPLARDCFRPGPPLPPSVCLRRRQPGALVSSPLTAARPGPGHRGVGRAQALLGSTVPVPVCGLPVRLGSACAGTRPRGPGGPTRDAEQGPLPGPACPQGARPARPLGELEGTGLAPSPFLGPGRRQSPSACQPGGGYTAEGATGLWPGAPGLPPPTPQWLWAWAGGLGAQGGPAGPEGSGMGEHRPGDSSPVALPSAAAALTG